MNRKKKRNKATHDVFKDSTGLIHNCPCGFTHRWEHGKPGDPSLEAKHTPTPWAVSGPVKEGLLNVLTGKTSEMKEVGYGVRAVEPRKFGGTVIGIEKGLSEANAEFLVRAVNMHAGALQLLKQFVKETDCYCQHDKSVGITGTCPIHEAMEWIAKAEGK